MHYLTIIYTTLVIGMVYIERNSHLDLLFQKALRYEHHRENFKESLSNNVTPFGLRIKKAPAIVPVNEDFHIKWQKILKSAEKELIQLLLLESETIQLEVDNSVNALFPEDQEEVRKHLKKKNRKSKEKLGSKRNGRSSPNVLIMGIITKSCPSTPTSFSK